MLKICSIYSDKHSMCFKPYDIHLFRGTYVLDTYYVVSKTMYCRWGELFQVIANILVLREVFKTKMCGNFHIGGEGGSNQFHNF